MNLAQALAEAYYLSDTLVPDCEERYREFADSGAFAEIVEAALKYQDLCG